MGTLIAHYEFQRQHHWGIVQDNQILPLGQFSTTSEFLKNRATLIASANTDGPRLPLEQVKILSPVSNPRQVICQGVNYADHRAEGGYDKQKPPYNMIFAKAPSSVTSAYSDITRPKHVRLLDYELELGLVVGQDVTGPVQVNDGNLTDYVAGIVIANDISARDVQIPQEQWDKGKSYRTFCPVGPYLYLLSRQETADIHNLNLSLWVNGELRQSANSGDMLYKPAETLTELSTIMDLHAGDLILTGTPAGVALHTPGPLVQKLTSLFMSRQKRMDIFVKSQLQNPRYLANGDVIRAAIRNSSGTIDLGMQQNTIVTNEEES